MIIRGTPPNKVGLIAVSNDCVINILQADNCLPRYIDNNYAYFALKDITDKGLIGQIIKYIYKL